MTVATRTPRSARLTCEVCGFVCGPSGMTNHRKIHDPDREMFPCPECGQVFAAEGGLGRHRATKHLETMDDRFFRNVHMTSQCWEWTASLDTKGYGRMMYYDRQLTAHKIAYMTMVGPIPEGLEIDHLCRNTRCVRPDHLEAVTHEENMRRAFAAAKGSPCPGCDFVAELPSALASHLKHRHPELFNPRSIRVNGLSKTAPAFRKRSQHDPRSPWFTTAADSEERS